MKKDTVGFITLVVVFVLSMTFWAVVANGISGDSAESERCEINYEEIERNVCNNIMNAYEELLMDDEYLKEMAFNTRETLYFGDENCSGSLH